MGFNFFEPWTQFWGLFTKAMPFLCLFGTVNINKNIIPDKKVIFTFHFTIRVSFKGFVMLLKELKLLIDEVCLLNI